ncbi:hypothetical protein [Actinorugispora endophytica]|uniref:Cellulose binding domain-containing protein n=1 Tax=Actinorugispora endophytica TaxID=1605990 RepID=A0A4R6V5L1_9ACTN|nr:hypothetical protein [Actinorugispora endophytica]TDQ55513.1 hypothetical protein EV190_101844 [Actinorugispora endophytica]
MTYPQQPPFPPEQGPQWQGGYPPPQYGPPAPPPPPRRGNPAGVVLVAAGGVVIVGLVIAIIVVLVRGGGSGGPEARQDPTPVTESSPAEETTPESTPETTPEETPRESPEETTEGRGVFPEAMDGSWSGTMTQYDPDGAEVSTWELEIHMTAGERVGTADLSMGDGTTCEWEVLATDSTDESVDLQYSTTDDGGGSCTSSGFVHLIVSGDQLAAGVATDWPTGVSTADGMLE